MEQKRRGQRSKGVRKIVKTRVPPELHAAAEAAAQRQGMTVTDWLGFLIARETGQTFDPQEPLPISA